ARAIFGRVEDLRGLIRSGLKGQLCGIPGRQCAAWAMVTQDSGRIEKRLKRQEQVCLRAFTSQANDRAYSWQSKIVQKSPIKVVELDVMTRTVRVHHRQLVIDHGGEGQGIVVLGNDRVPLRTRRMRQVNGHDATPGGLKIGVEIEHRID